MGVKEPRSDDPLEHLYLSDGVGVRARGVGNFWRRELTYLADARLRSHEHERPTFCIALEGGCTESFGPRRREFTPLTMSFMPAGKPHSLNTSPKGMRAFNIDMPAEWLRDLGVCSQSFEDYVFFAGGDVVRSTVRLYHESHIVDTASLLVIEGIVMEMLGEVTRHRLYTVERTMPAWLKRSLEYIHDAPGVVSLSAIARDIGIHPVHLARTFRKFIGCTLGEYARQVRVDRACRTMLTTNLTLVEIALIHGFVDQSHFIRVFKQFKGVTPGNFRSKAAQS